MRQCATAAADVVVGRGDRPTTGAPRGRPGLRPAGACLDVPCQEVRCLWTGARGYRAPPPDARSSSASRQPGGRRSGVAGVPVRRPPAAKKSARGGSRRPPSPRPGPVGPVRWRPFRRGTAGSTPPRGDGPRGGSGRRAGGGPAADEDAFGAEEVDEVGEAGAEVLRRLLQHRRGHRVGGSGALSVRGAFIGVGRREQGGERGLLVGLLGHLSPASRQRASSASAPAYASRQPSAPHRQRRPLPVP